MREIPLNNGHIAIVDDEDYDVLITSRRRWTAYKDGRTYYAYRSVSVDGKLTTEKMHRFILGLLDPVVQVDHIDRNGLNNQKSNLRLATSSQNHRNAVGVSGRYRGVHYCKSRRKFIAKIFSDGRQMYIGQFDVERDAAKAYDDVAIKLWGEFFRPNLPDASEAH